MLLPEVRRLKPDVAGVDWRVPIGQAREVLGPEIAVQGNLDPAAMLAQPEVAAARARAVCGAAGERGHVFNLGHGLFPDTPIDSVQAVLEAVHGPTDPNEEGWCW